MDPRATESQARLDAILPSFLAVGDAEDEIGSTWVVLCDLCVSQPHPAGDGAPDARGFAGLAPADDLRHIATILPAGSVLRYLGRWWEMWGYGYCRSVYLHLQVETGPLAGARVAFVDGDRWLVSGAVSHRTMSVAMLAPTATPTSALPALLDLRRTALRSIAATALAQN
jgi:hypothetical protein